MTDGHTPVTTDCTLDRNVCGLRDLLDRLGDTWSVLLTIELWRHGPLRFGQLLRSVEGLSQRMLTLTLRRLQRDGLVRRTVHDTSPPQVEYSLTEMGNSLAEMVRQLVEWFRENRDEIERSRTAWDRHNP